MCFNASAPEFARSIRALPHQDIEDQFADVNFVVDDQNVFAALGLPLRRTHRTDSSSRTCVLTAVRA